MKKYVYIYLCKSVPIGEKYEKNKNAPFNPPEMVYR